jgi:hypothetical protein
MTTATRHEHTKTQTSSHESTKPTASRNHKDNRSLGATDPRPGTWTRVTGAREDFDDSRTAAIIAALRWRR